MNSKLFRTGAVGALMLALTAAPCWAQAVAPVTINFDIPAEPLGKALQAFAAQTHQQLLFASDSVAGRNAPAIKGRFAPDAVLKRLLTGSGLQVQRAGPTSLVLKSSTPGTALHRTASMAVQTTRPLSAPSQGLVQVDAVPVPVEAAAPETVQEITVTGSHIRGVTNSMSPMQIISKDDMLLHGDGTVADALSWLPQAFNGQSNPITMLAGTDRLGTNQNMATGVNLRGLGANATLVLIDGRRMAGTGSLGDFTDVSAIPSAAVDHVEVLLDGASAIYGSDAVGGVVNIITKHNYDGADTTLRFGTDDGGVGTYVQATQAFGMHWNGGHALITYEHQTTDAVPDSARRFTADGDLVPLGGTNHDLPYSAPGNILALNSTRTGYAPVYAIPGGSGVGLTPSDFVAGTINYSNPYRYADLTPELARNGFYSDVSLDFGPHTTVDVEGRYNIRTYRANESPNYAIFQVTPANPFYVSPNGATSELIGYSPEKLFGPVFATGGDQNFELSAGLKHDLSGDWRLSSYVGFTGDTGRKFIGNLFNSANLNEALGNTPDNPATAYSTAVDGFFNPYGDGSAASPALKAFLGSGYYRVEDTDQVATASAQVDGTLYNLPGGALRAAFGAQVRHERFDQTVYSAYSSNTVSLTGGTPYSRNVGAVFGELNIPLVGPANARLGVQGLEVSVAGRVEYYDDVGTTANPKLGLLWRPIDDLAVRATYGTSFRAPSLSEIGAPTLVNTANVTNASGGSTLVLEETGGNADLKPETATTWTAGFDWTPHLLQGLRLGLSWFDIEFENEISNPGEQYLSSVLTTPAYNSLVHLINPGNASEEAEVNALLAKAGGGLAGLFPPSAYAAIVDARYVNTASMHVSGVDLNLDYVWRWNVETFKLSATGSYLDTFTRRQVASAPSISVLNTPNNPVNFKERATLDWVHGPFDTALTLNYVNSYKDPVADRPIDAWTTCDFALTWRAPAEKGPLEGASIALVVTNLLNAAPPFYNNPQAIGYDPANADPLGRILSIQLSKRW